MEEEVEKMSVLSELTEQMVVNLLVSRVDDDEWSGSDVRAICQMIVNADPEQSVVDAFETQMEISLTEAEVIEAWEKATHQVTGK